MFLTIFGRTDLRIGVSGSKFDAEADSQLRFAVAPQKHSKSYEKLIVRSKNFANICFWHQKMKCRGSSETRFAEVSRLYGPCLRGKQPFKVSHRPPN